MRTFDPGPVLRECPECEGSGSYEWNFPGSDTFPAVTRPVTCPTCDGKGQAMMSAHCPECGSAEVEQAMRQGGRHEYDERPECGQVVCRDCCAMFEEGSVCWR